MDKELLQLLTEAAIKLQTESEPLLASKQLNKSATVRAYGNIVNQGDDLFADILHRYLGGEIEVDEVVQKLNSRESSIINSGRFYKQLQGHHPIYQKLLANRLFNADPRKSLEVLRIIRDQLPSDIAPGTDPNKLIYTSEYLHRLLGHGGNYKNNTSGTVVHEASPKDIVKALSPEIEEAAYRAGYLSEHPAQKHLLNKISEALGVSNPLDYNLRSRRIMAKDSRNMLMPHLLEGVEQQFSRAIGPDVSNLFNAASSFTRAKGSGLINAGAFDLGRLRAPNNMGAITPELAIGGAGSMLAAVGALQNYKQNRNQGLTKAQAAFDTAGMLAGAEAGTRLGLAIPVPHPLGKAAVVAAGGALGAVAGEKGIELIREKANPTSRSKTTNNLLPQLMPTPKPVMANTSTGVAQLKAMPKSTSIDLANEAEYFIVNPIKSAFGKIFGKRES